MSKDQLLRVPSARRWIHRHVVQGCARVVPWLFADQITRPCFIVGCPRSGSSLFDQILGSHPSLATYPSEAIDLWHPQVDPWHRAVRRHGVPPIWGDARKFTEFSLAHRTPQQERHLKNSFRCFLWSSGKPILVQKCTLIGLMLPYVAQLFPDARFIHMLRDGRAAALSWTKRQGDHIRKYPHLYQPVGWDVSPQKLLHKCAIAWRDIVDAIDDARQNVPLGEDRFLEIKYEDFCREPNAILTQTAQFLSIDPTGFDPALRRAIQSQNYKVETGLNPQDHADLMKCIGNTMQRKGYGVEHSTKHER